jgi:HJR/Mrr/RecB family endonuclease
MTLKMDLAGDMLDGVGSDISGSALMPDSGPFGVTLDVNKLVDIHRVDSLDGATFEIFCALLFGVYPNKSYITPKQKGDGGVDFVVIGNDKKGLIGQCKFTTQEVLGWDAVKEVAAGSPAYQVKHQGIYFEKVAVTNKRFNSTAIEQAQLLGVKLIDRSELIRLLETNRIKEIALDEAIFKSYAK